MESIFYADAAALLGISEDTLRHAVARGALTKLPRQGQKQRLIKEQVMLFAASRKRLSLTALSPQEMKAWNEYAREAKKQEPYASGEDFIRALVEQKVEQRIAPLIQEAQTLNSEEEAAKQRLAAIQGQKEGFRKALSILQARAAALATAS